MKLAFTVHVDVDEHAFPRAQPTGRDQLTEHIRHHLTRAAAALPVHVRDAYAWANRIDPLPLPTRNDLGLVAVPVEPPER